MLDGMVRSKEILLEEKNDAVKNTEKVGQDFQNFKANQDRKLQAIQKENYAKVEKLREEFDLKLTQELKTQEMLLREKYATEHSSKHNK